jgi:hypothetical protein
LKRIYTGGILPFILYGAPVWKSVIDNTCYKAKLIRIQRLTNIQIAKAYRTVSNEALLTPINTKIEETAKYYECIKGKGNLLNWEIEVKRWTHPVISAKISEGQEDSIHNMRIYTDGSKNEHGNKHMESKERTVLVSADSQITLESLQNRKNHTYLIKKNQDESERNGDAELDNRIQLD